MKKVRFTVVLLVLVGSLPLISCKLGQQEKKPTIYNIPSSIRGQVMIVYDYKNGESSKVKGKKRFLEIPLNGTLYTQTEPTYGLANDEYFLISRDGSKEEIKIEVNTKSDTQMCIYKINTGIIDIDGSEYPYEAFMVCRKDSISYYNDLQIKIK